MGPGNNWFPAELENSHLENSHGTRQLLDRFAGDVNKIDIVYPFVCNRTSCFGNIPVM